MKGTWLDDYNSRRVAVRRRPLYSYYVVVASIALAAMILLFGYDSLLLQLSRHVHFLAEPSAPVETAFSWSKIVPSPALEYHHCFDGFQCARLEVPMGYHRTDGLGKRFAIAITRLPAKVPVTDPRYGGAVLINPGGPGGSGVAQVLSTGRNLQTIIDAEVGPSPEMTPGFNPLYFDIIGFDPRGVNNTTPGFSCFPSIFSERNFELQAEADGMLGSSSSSLMRNWQRMLALTQSCSDSLLNKGDDPNSEAIGEHVNTSPVARDMLEITERHAEWREKQGLEQQREEDRINGYNPGQTIASRTRWNRGEEKVLYWGRSYGTVLGATFAAMYPDRVGRVVLDGVVDLHKYYSGEGVNSVIDADAIFDRFFYYCDMAGSVACPFYVNGGPASIKSAYYAIQSQLLNASIPVSASSSRGPEVVTWTDLKTIQRISVYQPLSVFPLFAKILSELRDKNGSSLATFKQRNRKPSCLSDECLNSGLWSQECTGPSTGEAYSTQAILCTDAEYAKNTDMGAFNELWSDLRVDSETIGDYWASILLDCAGWKAAAKWRFNGPFSGNTSHPLLFVSTSLDPVTPLSSAKKMSKSFPGSVVLEQQSEGHTTISTPSLCVARLIRNYFQTGQLPAAGTLCPVDIKPLIGVPESEAGVNKFNDMSSADRYLYDALLTQMHIHLPSANLPL
ncbi:TAP-like protein-domain-containing protein [Talaromyces proteolyticus]|uniref:TAP-like protein-domain-containing protein n=1 Tax=Talaromyces proteolyticus TaxID=1131652 RepID=A0AAD4PW88_9EURO|nr:TAP-like protein-domain-containing protein [Talaromyces proteolyticus]KAH8691642.1 TAP-like protein-domain-containing protein [Talaromyces proteolyticus]